MSHVAQRLSKTRSEKLFDLFLSRHKLPLRARLSSVASVGASLGGRNTSAEKRRRLMSSASVNSSVKCDRWGQVGHYRMCSLCVRFITR